MPTESELRYQLCDVVRGIHARGWALATGGNFSALLEREPMRLLMTPSGVDKGELCPEGLLIVNDRAEAVLDQSKIQNPKSTTPSAEALLHVVLVQERNAGAVLHTHSVANTVLSLHNEEIKIEGYEMLKGLSNVTTHQHTERIPVLNNSQDMNLLSSELRVLLRARPDVHGFVLRGHGLYTWGDTLFEAKRHVECLEFLLNVELHRAGL